MKLLQITKFFEPCTCVSFSSPSHSRPADYMSCSKIFALIVKVARNQIGSKSVAIFFRKFRLVYNKVSSGAFSLNINASSLAFHHTPSVFAHGSGSVSRSTSDFRSCNGTCSNTLDELHSHFRAYIPAADSNRASCV